MSCRKIFLLNKTLLLCCAAFAANLFAATDVRVDFTLNTTDSYGNPIQQHRYYYVYRPNGLPLTTPVPMVLFMEASPNAGPDTFFHRKADQAGFLVVSCSFSGNSSGTPGTGWVADDPRIAGYEDMDYISEVINQVRASNNARDAFIAGLSKGGHISLAYACVRPSMLKAAASLDEFMGLTSNLPSAPLPIIMMQGTLDTNVPYTMVKDTLDAWRAVDNLKNATPVTTYEPSARIPGMVSRATWRDDDTGLQVAFVTIIGGTHTVPTPSAQTGYDSTDGLWNFFSQFLTRTQDAPKIVSQPVNNIQISGQPASFWISATGSGTIGYQWQRNGFDIPGATANWYTTPPTNLSDDQTQFQVVVSSEFGVVTSTAATLTVNAPAAGPTIITHPEDQAVVSGQLVSFTVVATGPSDLAYQWRKNGVDIAGATSAELDIPAAITSDSGASFTVLVTSGSTSVITDRATLTVTPPDRAPIILANPARVRTLVNQQATFAVTAWSQSPMSYQWQKGAFTGNMADIPGANDSTYTTPLTTLADHLTLFRCVVSNHAGSVTSADEMLFVTAAPVPPNSITSLITASAQTGVPFNYAIVSSGGTSPVAYSASPLPDGLSVDPDSGAISGTPAAAGTSKIVITAANTAGRTSMTLTLTVTDSPPVVTIEDWRWAHFGASATDPTIAGDMADPDGDGYLNIDEFNFGSDPLDPASAPMAAADPTRSGAPLRARSVSRASRGTRLRATQPPTTAPAPPRTPPGPML